MLSSFILTRFSKYLEFKTAIKLGRLQIKSHHHLRLLTENLPGDFIHLLMPQSKDGSINHYRYVYKCSS